MLVNLFDEERNLFIVLLKDTQFVKITSTTNTSFVSQDCNNTLGIGFASGHASCCGHGIKSNINDGIKVDVIDKMKSHKVWIV